jgi:hypothetical protein
LEDKANAVTADAAHLRFARLRQVGLAEHDLARDDLGNLGQKAHDSQRRHALAGA